MCPHEQASQDLGRHCVGRGVGVHSLDVQHLGFVDVANPGKGLLVGQHVMDGPAGSSSPYTAATQAASKSPIRSGPSAAIRSVTMRRGAS